MKYLCLILFLQISFKECTIDINIQELVYIADHLTAVECRRLFASLHFASYNLPVSLPDAETKVPKEVPCIKLLIKWNSGNETFEGKGKSHALVEHRLRQLGKKELADWLGKLVFHKLAKNINKSLEDESYFAVKKPGINQTIFEDKDSRFAGQRWTTIDSILSVTLCGMLFITVSAFYRMLKLTFRRARAKRNTHKEQEELVDLMSAVSIDSDQETVYEYDVENGKSNHVSFDLDVDKIPSEDDPEK
ncbi:uncharacterized protein LOC111348910 [Spodoptera litura]|uniref:Uncharacterized protein LOC111348910 n=1 Tax=Spodoptera litura TaxID=69820 RepID=A0A9J7DSM9_SPOLT|nr:uncharacterized protein LOC111348910 [Spodoptera litura]